MVDLVMVVGWRSALWMSATLAPLGCLLDFDTALIDAAEFTPTLAGAGGHTCSLDDDGVRCWGDGRLGQLGRPVNNSDPFPARVSSNADFRTVAVGGSTEAHSCGVLDDATLWCWGTNGDAQLGVPSAQVGSTAMPMQVPLDVGVVSVSLGTTVSCALDTAGVPWCWGWNGDGRLGLDDADTVPPTRIETEGGWRHLTVGNVHGCAIKGEDGRLLCFGTAGPARGRADTDPKPAVIDERAQGWRSVSAGVDHTCGIRVDGSLWCWGMNDSGQLGRDTAGVASVPPVRVGDRTGWTQVASGRAHSCALRAGGSAWCWGANDDGQLASTSAGGPHAVRVDQTADWRELVAGFDHTCGRRVDGVLLCWGANGNGQLGIGDFTSTSTPQPTRPAD